MTSLQHRALRRVVVWLFAGPLLGCNERESLCDLTPQWCQPFELAPIPEPFNLSAPATPISVHLATPDATPEPTANSSYRVLVKQESPPPVLQVAVLPSPETIEAGWPLRPRDLAPLATSEPKLRCGPGTLTLYARRYQTSPGTPLVAGDPDSANYVQHGTTNLQIIGEPMSWTQASSVDMSLAGWTVTGLDLGPPSLGSDDRTMLYATVQYLADTSVSPEVRRASLSNIASLTALQARHFAGVGSDGNIALNFRYMASQADWIFCDPATSNLAAPPCVTANDLFMGKPPKSLAVDAKGRWLVSVDSVGKLRIQGYSYQSSPTSFKVQAMPMPIRDSTFRQAVVGDLDGNGYADVLAWGNPPHLLLQDSGSFAAPQGDNPHLKAFMEELTKLADSDSVIAISHERCDRSLRLLVAQKTAITAYVIGPDWTLGEAESVVSLSDPVTALLRKDTDGNGVADRLIVATKPTTGSPKLLVFTPTP
ncbi:MAG TPA: hypothetical protein PKI03_22405 [Pseudomonadota bacterium]|nr:hypothetical protein [Pseudomonadota bacterium]HNN95053.1 hypothetical protein [Pseudomonadota bacterium]